MFEGHLDPAGGVILWGTLLLFMGIVGRYIAKLFNQSGVLGELLMGVLVGNVCYFAGMQLMFILRDSPAVFSIVQNILNGMTRADAVNSVIKDPHYANQVYQALSGPNAGDWVKISYVVDILSRYGVILLLFMVGLESSVQELKKTGKEALGVAIIGVLAPITLGIVSVYLLMTSVQFNTALFIGATLSATSVGITARVLKDMKKTHTRESKTILGAAMIDDVLGLVILAVVSNMAISHHIDFLGIGKIIALSLLFFPAALFLGPRILRSMISWFDFMDPWESKLLISFIFVMGFSWMATLVKMSTIIGAFVAGIILHDGFFQAREREQKKPLSIKHLMAPFEAIFAPLFFILIGLQVRIETFLDLHVLTVAVVLIVVAIIGKVASGLGAAKRDDRLLIGIGMMPRGEVGLIFASVGKTIGVIDDSLFSSVIMMVVVTTILTPFLMKLRYNSHDKKMQENKSL
ncbi:MAG: cation:proton antiporter [Legionellaceae bacterium]|nr:cation:proton antiporter [Legionellaceae bacterium]